MNPYKNEEGQMITGNGCDISQNYGCDRIGECVFWSPSDKSWKVGSYRDCGATYYFPFTWPPKN